VEKVPNALVEEKKDLHGKRLTGRIDFVRERRTRQRNTPFRVPRRRLGGGEVRGHSTIEVLWGGGVSWFSLNFLEKMEKKRRAAVQVPQRPQERGRGKVMITTGEFS